ncbi:branched-chain amino acid aminotransferase [Scrofimicrobium sp. R131]|uniref:branched-chain-amino-acid transaminase n=1 Tax=Scrofimicrobium appendicitidis TaxID=3079930 RepID=A0AAU7V5I0_9ACTO
MTESTVRQLSELEEAAAVPVPNADEVASRFPVSQNPTPASDEERAQALRDLDFGTTFSDHLAIEAWNPEEGWHGRSVEAYAPLALDPSAAVLHYGQEIFEGLKAYRWADGSVWTFRPTFNAARMNQSAVRMAMPSLPVEDFLGSIVQLVRVDANWVPSIPDSALYLRPMMIASEPFLGVRPAREYLYLVIASPVGPYFKGGLKPVSIWVSTDYHRAAPGGTGAAKTGGNYAASLLPQQLAAQQGFDQVCYLDAATNSVLEELGGMNVFVRRADGTVLTPALSGSILEGGTRSAIMQLLADRGVPVTETALSLAELVAGIEAGEITEMFACGTAAVVTPIGRIAGDGFDFTLPGTELTAAIHDELGGIQRGLVPDRHGWMYRLV